MNTPESEGLLNSVLALDAPWPLEQVLEKLAEAIDHLLTHHGCDTHGHEQFRVAQQVARALAGRARDVQAVLAQQAHPPAPESEGEPRGYGALGMVPVPKFKHQHAAPESEGAKCGTCGEHANEHGAINHEFTKGGGLSCEGSTGADVRADRATEETGADRPAAPISEQVTDERLGLWHQFAKPGVQGYAIGYDEYCALLQRLRSQPGEREALLEAAIQLEFYAPVSSSLGIAAKLRAMARERE